MSNNLIINPNSNLLIDGFDGCLCVSGTSSLKLLNCLKSGYRHCFILLKDRHSDCWIYCDPLVPKLEIQVVQKAELMEFMINLIGSGHRILPFTKQIPSVRLKGGGLIYWQLIAPFRFYHCVQFSLEIMGRPLALILTPYRLCKYLIQQWNL